MLNHNGIDQTLTCSSGVIPHVFENVICIPNYTPLLLVVVWYYYGT